MDVKLKLQVAKKVCKEEYVKYFTGNSEQKTQCQKIDYGKFRELLFSMKKDVVDRHLKAYAEAKKQMLELESGMAAQKELILPGYLVLFRKRYRSKKHNHIEHGWVVVKRWRQRNQHKWTFRVRNMFTGETVDTNKGKIKKFHRSIWKDPVAGMECALSRLIEADGLAQSGNAEHIEEELAGAGPYVSQVNRERAEEQN